MTIDDERMQAMRSAYEKTYQRAWDDPAGIDLRTAWVKAWIASRSVAFELLSEALSYVPDAAHDGSRLHLRISGFLGYELTPQEREELDLVKARAWFSDNGVVITDWARDNEFGRDLVYAVLSGRIKGLRGRAFQVREKLSSAIK